MPKKHAATSITLPWLKKKKSSLKIAASKIESDLRTSFKFERPDRAPKVARSFNCADDKLKGHGIQCDKYEDIYGIKGANE